MKGLSKGRYDETFTGEDGAKSPPPPPQFFERPLPYSFFIYCNNPSRGLRVGGLCLKATVQKLFEKRTE